MSELLDTLVKLNERQSVLLLESHAERDALQSRLDAAETALAWQPIETAPKRSEVLLAVELRAGMPGKMLVGHYMPGGHCIEDHPAIDEGWYFWNGSMFDKASKPTHWMPLPKTP